VATEPGKTWHQNLAIEPRNLEGITKELYNRYKGPEIHTLQIERFRNS
jgi:hypothetical protein